MFVRIRRVFYENIMLFFCLLSEVYASDEYFRTWLENTAVHIDLIDPVELASDDETADEYFIVVGSQVFEDITDHVARAQRSEI